MLVFIVQRLWSHCTSGEVLIMGYSKNKGGKNYAKPNGKSKGKPKGR